MIFRRPHHSLRNARRRGERALRSTGNRRPARRVSNLRRLCELLEERTLLAILGPDSFGYVADDDATFSYEDISGTGTALGQGDDDNDMVALGFNFDFYGTTYADVFVGSNGYLTFGSGDNSFSNQDLTDPASTNITQPVMAALWDDWDPGQIGSDDVYVQTLGTPSVDQRFVAQWNDVEHNDFPLAGTVDFQAVLFETGEFEFRYNDVTGVDASVDNGASATVGIRNANPPAPANGEVLQISFDAANISNSQAIHFLPTNVVVDANDGVGATDDGTPDNFVIRRNAADDTLVEVEINGAVARTWKIAALDSITVMGSSDNDSLVVDSSDGLISLSSGTDADVRFLGGDGFDSLEIVDSNTRTDETLSLGATPGSGRHSLVDQITEFTGLEPFFSNAAVPNLNINVFPGLASLLQDDNQINYVQRPGFPLWGRVTVDNSEPINFINKDNLIIDADAGDDVINLNNPVLPTGMGGAGTTLQSITVRGQDPTASDKVIVNAFDAGPEADPNNVNVAVTAVGAATVTGTGLDTVANALTINVDTAEQLVIDGTSAASIDLTVSGTAGNNERFVHTPGAGPDAGSVLVIDEDAAATPDGTLLPVDYENLGLAGTVTVDGIDGTDTLVALGTDGSDTITADFTAADAIDIDLISAAGTHVDLLTTNVDNYELRSLEGDDVTNLVAPLQATGTFAVFGGGPGVGSDTLHLLGDPNPATAENVTILPDAANPEDQDVTGLGTPIDVSGKELITYIGAPDGAGAANDTLTVDPGAGDNIVRVDHANTLDHPLDAVGPQPADRVTSDSLPEIQFARLQTFTADANSAAPSGSDTVSFKTWFLAGAVNTNYQMVGDVTDSLVIEGVDGALAGDDSHTLTLPAAGSVAVTDNNGTNVTVTETSGNLGRVQLNTLGGDDTVLVDVNGAASDVIGVPITVDGGGGSDVLQVSGTPTTAVDEVIYTPGPNITAGRLLYEDAANVTLMTIDFLNLEPVQDNVAANALTVGGVFPIPLIDSSNAINYVQGPGGGVFAAADVTGLVSFDDFETVEFAHKDNLVINAGAGDDVINLNNPVLPTGMGGAGTTLQSITVRGQDPTASDKVIVNAFDAGPEADPNNVNVAVTAVGAATVTGTGLDTVANALTINVDTAEQLVIDGTSAASIDLTVSGTAGNNERFVHTPGAGPDAGSVLVIDEDAAATPDGTLLPVDYENLGLAGTVTVDGIDGTDTLVALGTDGSDTITADFTAADAIDIDLISAAGTHVDLLTTNVDNYELRSLEGDDVTNLVAPLQATGTFAVFGGGPGVGSDTLHLLGDPNPATAENVTILPDAANPEDQDVTGLGTPIDVSGKELITYIGAPDGAGAANDTLTVDPGAGDNIVRVDHANTLDHPLDAVGPQPADRVTSDSLPEIQFARLQTFTADANSAAPSGSDTVSFKTWFLAGAVNTNYQMVGDVTDSLVIEGVDGALAGDDSHTLTLPAAGSVAVTDNNGTNVTVTETSGNLGRVQLNTLGGDDTVLVDVNGAASDVIGVPITVDGGGGSDVLQATGTPTTAVDTVTYSPGPKTTEGRATYDADADATNGVLMTIDFDNLEPFQDNILAVNLVINGLSFPTTTTNDSDEINYTMGPGGGIFGATPTGLVSVNALETYEFNNKTNLIINARAGSDTINLNYQDPAGATVAPLGLASINVNGGDPTASDKLIVNNVAGVVDFSTLQPGLAAATVPAAVLPLLPPLPLGQGAGTVLNTGGGSPPVNYVGIEDLDLVGQAVDGDAVQIGGTVGIDTFEYTPGDTLSEGSVSGTMDQTNTTGVGPFTLPNVTFSGVFVPPAPGPVPPIGIFGIGVGINDDPATQGGADTVIYNGTSENDVFQVVDDAVYLNINGENPLVAPFPFPLPLGNVLATLAPGATSTTQIIINAGDGDDNVNVLSAVFPAIAYDVNGGNPGSGSDVLNLVDPEANGIAVTVQVVQIIPDPVDPTQQDVFGYAAAALPIDVTGMELIAYTGGAPLGAPNDTLIVDPVGADDQIRVEAQAATPGAPAPPPFAPGAAGLINAKVTSQTMPEIQFRGTTAFHVSNPAPPLGFAGGPLASPGAVEATFVTLGLDPVTVYNLNGNSEDKLVIEGADTFPDLYSVTNPTGLAPAALTRTISVFDHNTGVVVNNVFTPGGAVGPAPLFTPGEINFNTLAGDDQVFVHAGPVGPIPGAPLPLPGALAGVDLIDTRIVYDGGTGGDILNVAGTPATPVVNEVYTPGPDPTSGRIDYGTALVPADLSGATLTGMMQIEFSNLQPVVTVVPTANLVVNGNNAPNSINDSQGPNVLGLVANTGIVSVDNHETIEYANKVALTINGNAGNDTVNLQNTGAAVPTGLTLITVNGGLDDDTVDASASTLATPLVLNGNVGNDTLVGGLAADFLNGGLGNDTLVNSPGNDTYDGANGAAGVADTLTQTSGYDTLVIRGTLVNDVMDALQVAPSAAALHYTLNYTFNGGVTEANTLIQKPFGAASGLAATGPTIEEVRIEAGAGNDLIRVAHDDAYTDGMAATGNPMQMVRFNVIGDAPNASDRLVVQDLGIGDLVLVRQAPDERSGRVTIAPAVNTTTLNGFFGDIVYSAIERLDIAPLTDVSASNTILNRGTGTDGFGRIVVFEQDPFELNEIRTVATDVNDVTRIDRNPTIDPGVAAMPPFPFAVAGDEDWYEFRAPKTGTFAFNVLFEQIGPLANGRTGLPGMGNLDIQMYNDNGALIATSNTATDDESITITVMPDESYFLRVLGTQADLSVTSASPAINVYDVTVVRVDDLGPQVIDPDGDGPLSGVHITEDPETPLEESAHNLFGLKGETTTDPPVGGPTPLVNSLTINFWDLPMPRSPGDVYVALDPMTAGAVGNYEIKGDHNGIIDIETVTVINDALTGTVVTGTSATNFTAQNNNFAEAFSELDDFYNGSMMRFTTGALAGQTQTITDYSFNEATDIATFTTTAFTAAPVATDAFEILQTATARVILTFDEPLPDDRFTLTVNDSVRDPAWNKLDGESDADEPFPTPTFPSGDGVSGGDFVARFTVDSRPEIGVWSDKSVYVDTNGNFVLDPEGKDNDDVNEDIIYVFSDNLPPSVGAGFATDNIFAGNFPSGDTADGFDKLGTYGRVGGAFRFLLDGDNDGVPETVIMPGPLNGLPVAGNFSAATPGDEVGVFDGNTWYLAPGFAPINSGLRGLPIVGDFNGDGFDDLATYNETEDRFEFDFATGVGTGFGGGPEATIEFGFSGIREYPVAADMDQDGIDDIGLFVPDRGGVTPRYAGEWYMLVSGQAPGTMVPNAGALNHAFSPQPFGNDLFAQYGDEFAIPIVGNFDPPVAAGAGDLPDVALFQNAVNHYDVNGDSLVTPADVLQIFNDLNTNGARSLPPSWNGPDAFLDVNGDQSVTPLDALIVINAINRASLTAATASANVDEPTFATSIVGSSAAASVADVSSQSVSVEAAVPVASDLLDGDTPAAPASDANTLVTGGSDGAALSETSLFDDAISDIAVEVAEAWLGDVGDDGSV